MDKPAVTIVLPTYNEAANIARLMEEVSRAVGRPHEIIVVDDDSPDGTWKAAEGAGVKGSRVVRRTTERGLASAIAHGVELARGDAVVWMDCDFSMPPARIPALLQALDAGADLAVGSRYLPGGKDARPLMRRLTSAVVNRFARWMLGTPVSDLDSGFMAVRKSVFESVPIRRTGYGEYCIELIVQAHRKGFRVVETPYVCVDRKEGESKTNASFGTFIKHGIQYFSMALRLRFGWSSRGERNRRV